MDHQTIYKVILYDDYVQDINLCLDQVFDFLEIERMIIDTSTRHMQGGWMFRYKFLRNLLVPDNSFKSFFKHIVASKKIRHFIRKKIMGMSTIETPQLSMDMREKLVKYYKQDILNLSNLLERDLSHWFNEI